MAKRTSNAYYLFEYAVFRVIETVVRILPIEIALWVARGGGLLWMLFGKRQTTENNLRLAYGDTISDERRRQIARGSVEHFAMMAIEIMKFDQVIQRHNWSDHIDFQHGERLFDVLARGRGAVVATGHLGNFEMISYFFNLTSPSMLAVGRRLNNPYVDAHFWATRKRMGERVINKKGGLKRMALALRQGDCIGFVADQDAGRSGVFADLFGTKASTYSSFAALALMMKVPVVPGYCCRVGHPMRYRIYVDRPIEPVDTGDRERDIFNIVQEFNHRLEKYVREFPEQWLWGHRRWKTRPPEELAQTQKAAAEPVAAGR